MCATDEESVRVEIIIIHNETMFKFLTINNYSRDGQKHSSSCKGTAHPHVISNEIFFLENVCYHSFTKKQK